MTLPPRDSVFWAVVLTCAFCVYVGAHWVNLSPQVVEFAKDTSAFIGAVSAKLAWSPLRASDNVACRRSWLRQILDQLAAEVP